LFDIVDHNEGWFHLTSYINDVSKAMEATRNAFF
jgi:hypothetical protein